MVTSATSLGRTGTFDWLVQRVTAVVLFCYFVFIVGWLLGHPHLQYDQWRALFSSLWMRVFSLLALVSLLAHAWVGVWTITTDYFTARLLGTKGNVLRWIFQAGSGLVVFFYLVWGVRILWS